MSERGVYRGVYSALIDDPDYQGLPAKARLVLLTARVCKQAGPAGIFRYYPALLAAQTGLKVKEVEVALVELEQMDWIRREGPILWIRNALRHDPNMHLVNKLQRRAVENWVKELPRLRLVLTFCDYYEIDKPFKGPSEGIRNKEDGLTEDGGRRTENGLPPSSGLTTPDPPPPNGQGHEHGPAAMRTAARELLAFLNKKASKHFQVNPGTVDPIIARLREGATVEQCWAVIAMKTAEWKNDGKMRKFLRPETLFDKKHFASYQGELPATAFEETPP